MADGARPASPPAKRARVADELTATGTEDDELLDAEYWTRRADAQISGPVRRDLYLETINRSLLDFDFEKVCSVSLSNVNIYACLVCGRYFQGRGKRTPAYFHAINDEHRVFMNMNTAQVYVLPDNYAVDDASLGDIQYQLRLTYPERQMAALDAGDVPRSRDLSGATYLPVFVGINNIGQCNAMNAVLLVLLHVPPLRNYFLRGGVPASQRRAAESRGEALPDAFGHSTELVRRFSAFSRRLWNPRAFRSHVSPHELLQEVANASQGRYRHTEPVDPVDFLSWLLNHLHFDLAGGSASRKRRTVITECFQGALRLESQKVIVRTGLEDENIDKLDYDGRLGSGQQDEHGRAQFNIHRAIKVDEVPFLFLTVDLPPLPVFQDVVAENIIPQVPISHVLAKYDGVTIQEALGTIRRYHIMRLPPYLVVHYKRFTKNQFVEERNTTIVNFPTVGLDLRDYVEAPAAADGPSICATYNLLANITHEATAGTVRDNSVWRAQVHTRGGEHERWFQAQDLLLEEVNKQMLFLGESYVQIWERVGAADEMERADALPLPRVRRET